MSKPIRILHVLASVNRGGAESRTMDLYRNINREKVQFDFLINNKKTSHYEAEILSMGGRVYRIPRFFIYNYFSYRKAVREFFRVHHDFKMIQGHLTSSAAIFLPIAKKAGVPVTIAHSRNAGVDPGLKGVLTHLFQFRLNRIADHLFACSRIAGIAVFGRKAWEKGKITYIPNAIETEKFEYDETSRTDLRDKFGLNGKFVIGHVGRFDYQKNHKYLLKVFYEVQKQKPESCLFLVGDGNGKEDFQIAARQMGIAEKIVYAGRVDEPWKYYQAMDYFVFPSFFEGLPGVVVEAQTSGLKCLISDTIADEVMVTENIKAMSIKNEPIKWAEFIIKTCEYKRIKMAGEIKAAGFDASIQAKKMENFYLSGSIASLKENKEDKKKKKIMLISPTLCQGGFERVCVNTARLLSPFYDVSIVLFDSGKIAFDVSGLKIIDIKRGVKQGLINKLGNIFIRTIILRKLKRTHKPDIAYSFGATANIVNALSKGKFTKTWLGIRSYMDMGEKFKLRLFMRKADLLICCSQFIVGEFREKYSYNKAIALYNPYDIKEIKQLAESSEPIWPWPDEDEKTNPFIHIMSMGRDDDIKGYWHTIKIFYLVQKKFPQARLTILGAGKFSEYRKLAADLGISDKVFFTGMQKNPYQYLKKGTIYLLNSLMEGFPNALIEAMAMGMAVVACDCRTGPAEILLENAPNETGRFKIYQDEDVLWGEYGVLVPVMNEEKNLNANNIIEAEKKISAIVIKLLSDPGLLEKYRQSAIKRAGDFTNDAYVDRINDLII
ncbi:MAG: glycosyltransferase [Lachnospiraceae bacterium]|nr:glycosyltransferase [Lachnospiraceae bacterium]